MATTPRPQTGAMTRELLAAGVVRVSADGSTLLNPDGTALAPAIVVSSAAPNNADGRPDGTIYIQTA